MTRTDATRPYPAAPTPGVSSLSEIGPFRRLRLALSLSAVGQWLAVPALTAAVVALTMDDDVAARAQAVGAVLGLLLLPAVVLAPLAGTFAASLDRRIALLAVDALRFVIVLTVPLLDMLPWTLAAAFLVGLLSVLWTPVALAAPPALVPDGLPGDETDDGTIDLRAAARRSALRAVSGAAPAAAALFTVLALIGAGTLAGASHADGRADLVLYVNAAVFLLAAVAVALVRGIPSAEPVRVPSPLALVFRGGRGGRTDAPRGLGAAITGAALAAGALVGAARVHAAHLGGGDAGYGTVLIALTVGLGFGIFLGPRVLGPFSRRRLLGLAVVAGALALAVAALVDNLPVAVFATALVGVAAGVAWACGTSVLVGAVDPETGEEGEPPAPAYARAVALVAAFVAAAAVPPLAGVIGAHRIDLGGGFYDLAGTDAALLAASVLALLAGFVAYRRADDRRGVPLVPDLRAALRGEVYVPPEEAAATEPEPEAVRNPGVFIAFEGGEGAGKTTQARLAAIWLRDHGYDVVTTHEPGATKIGMRLRAMLLDRETTGLSRRAETLLYAADRADHVTNVIAPAMERGAIVVSDRYIDSSLAYQGFGREQPVEEIAGVNAWATGGLVPDLTVLLEVPPETGLGRLSAPADRIESESRDFHDRVRAGFRALAEAEPDRYLVLDASRPQPELSREIQYKIREILPDPIPLGTEDATHTFPAIRDL